MIEIKTLIRNLDDINQEKKYLAPGKILVLSILAGIYISFGSILYISVSSMSDNLLATKMIGSLVFCLGLILVVVGKAELFTGNNLLIISVLNKKITFISMLKKWCIVYLGNAVGAFIVIFLVHYSGLSDSDNISFASKSVDIATSKVDLSLVNTFFRAILCNIFVCLAVWISYIASSVGSKILAIIFPITCFVVMGFEHSIANMFIIPMGWLNQVNFNLYSSFSSISLSSFLGNLIPVTLGNIIGGVFFVGVSYWYCFSEEISDGKK